MTAPGSHTPFLLRRRAAEEDPAIGAARCRLRRTCLTAAARAALPRSTTATGASFGHADLHAGTFGLLWLLASDRFSEQWREEQCGRGNGGEAVGAEARSAKAAVSHGGPQGMMGLRRSTESFEPTISSCA